MKRLSCFRVIGFVIALSLWGKTVAAPPDASAPPLFLNVERVVTKNEASVRAAMNATGWKTIKKIDGGIASEKADGSKLYVHFWRGKPIQVIAWLAPPFPEVSPGLFRSVLGISATPPAPDPDDSNGGSRHRGTSVILVWNHLHPTGKKSFGPVFEAEVHRWTYETGEECVVRVDLADRATIKKWENS